MKLTLELDGYTDRWDMEERFEKYYEQMRMHRQMKNGRPVDRKEARKLWKEHLKHIASYFMVEYWDEGLEDHIENNVARMDARDDKMTV